MAGRIARKVAFVDSVPYPVSTPDDPAETVNQVGALDRGIVATDPARPRQVGQGTHVPGRRPGDLCPVRWMTTRSLT